MANNMTKNTRSRFDAWLDSIGKPDLIRETVYLEAMNRIDDQLGLGELEPCYELPQKYTVTGRPETFFCTRDDIDIDEDEEQ